MGSVHETPASGYRARMIVYAVLLLVLVGIIMVVAAFLDRRRGREIEHDLSHGIPVRPPGSQTSPGAARHRKG